MRVFALFDRWARSKSSDREQGSQKSPPSGEDRSSMSDLVRLLTEIDVAETSRAPR